MSRRADVLELAVLGLLHDSPMHGYELRKRLNAVLGAFRALSYGTLYPALKTLLADGAHPRGRSGRRPAPALAGKRARIVYELTAEGKERFQSLVASRGPRRGRTRPSTSTSPSSPGPTPPPGCRSSRVGAPGCRSGWTASASR